MRSEIGLCVALLALVGRVGAADVVLSEMTTYDVAKTVTQSVADRLTGPGGIIKTGQGTLTLANAANDFAGGIGVTGGVVQVMGTQITGPIVVNGKGQMIELLAPKVASGYTVYTNPLFFVGDTAEGLAASGGTDSIWSLSLGPDADTKLKLTGGITATRNFRLFTFTTVKDPTSCAGPEVLFEGPVQAEGKTIYVASYGTVSFLDKVVAAAVYFGDAWSAGGKVYLASPQNQVGTWWVDYERVYCAADNVLAGGLLRWYATGENAVTDRGVVNLEGFSQTVSGIVSPVPSNSGWTKPFAAVGDFLCVKSSATATLTISGQAKDCQTYTTLRGPVSLVLDAKDHPGFTQTFCRHPNTMTGTLTVRSGTLRLAEASRFASATAVTVGAGGTFACESTATSPALAAAKNVKIEGTFDASQAAVYPFPAELDSLELGAAAVLKLPAGSLLNTKSLIVGGQTLTAGLVTSERFSGLQGVTIRVTGAPTAAVWTDGAGDGLFSSTGNWSPTPDFVYGGMQPTFAAAGTEAVVDVAAVAVGLAFDGRTDFTLRRAASAKTLTLAGDIDLGASDVTRRYVIDTPIRLLGDNKVNFASPAELVFRNAFVADDALTGTLSTRGTNVVFQGTNVLAGRLEIGVNPMTATGLLATPGHAYEDHTAPGIRINLQASGGPDGGNKGSGLCLSNAVVEKALFINNRIGSVSVMTPANTTNEIRGFVGFENYSHEYFSLKGKSLLTLSGGLETIHSFRVYDGGTLCISNRPAAFLGSAGLNPDSGTVILAVAGNYVTNMCVGYNYGNTVKVETTVDYALTNGNVQVGGNGADFGKATALTSGTYTLDLHATTQACQRIGVMTKGTLTGAYPAMLEVTEGRLPTGNFALFGYSVVGAVTGGVGFHMRGEAAGVLLLTNRVFASCGDLKVTSGTLEFADATWRNGTNVTVAGSGTLKLGRLSRGDVFDAGHVTLHLGAEDDSWQIDLPAGSSQRVAFAYDAEGRLLPAGVYGNSAVAGVTRTRYSAHFPVSGGTILVTHRGSSLILR